MSDPTRFDLDERQRAMLAEMGVRVWWPQAPATAPQLAPEQASGLAHAPAPAPQAAAAPVQPAAQAPVPSHASAPVPPRVPVAPPTAPHRSAPAASPASAPAAAALHEDARPLPAGLDQMDWDGLQATASECRACGLCVGRKHTDFGVGERRARWMVIADAPGESEDLQDGLFVGQAGKLLDNMLKAVGLSRQAAGEGAVYITCPVKCRPAGSRNPQPQELAACAPYLARQVALVQPSVILLMGRFAVQSALQSTEPIGKLRGRLHTCQGVPAVVSYHPDYLLRNQADKAKAWADLLLALKTVQG